MLVTDSAFVLPAQFTSGNAGRNTMRGDQLIQFDMSLIKNFRIGENKSFDFRAPVLNGQVASTRNKARVFEFGLKFSY